MSKAVLYARVSSVEQKKEGYSIPAQIELLQEYACKNDIKIIQEFTDSETAKQAGRTNFNEMLQFLKKNKDIKTILVEKTDRLYRNFKDYVLLDESEYEIHLVKENVVLSKDSRSHEKFVHGIKVLMAKNFIDNLSEEVKKGMKQKAEQGYYPNKPPYGYLRTDKKISKIDPESAPFVKRAFEIYAEGNKSLTVLSEQLYKEGFIYRPERPKMGKNHLERILKNPFYIGKFKFNNIIYNGLHEPLITKELFELAQIAFKKDNKPLYRNEHDFVLAGMLTCESCGCSITAELKKGKYIYYHCTGGKGKCEEKKNYIRQENLLEQFDEVVKQISLDEEQKNWIIEALKLSLEDEKEYNQERINSLNVQKSKIKSRLEKIYIDKLDGTITNEFWQERHTQWNNELETIQVVLNAHEKTSVKYLEEGIKILELCTNAYRLYSKKIPEDKVKLLKILLSNSTLKGGKIGYEYKKPFDILAKGLACNKDHARRDSNPRPFGS
jgi:site-specific DNA recombinase